MSILFPPSDRDPIIRLHDYYFLATELMYSNFEKLFSKLEKEGKLSNKKLSEFQDFSQLWLATLAVVCEGFKDSTVNDFYSTIAVNLDDPNDSRMQVHWNSVHHKMSQLGDELYRYRNATFHFQPNMDRLDNRRLGFLQHSGRHNPLEWARELQREMRLFFGSYRHRAAALYMHEV